LVRRKYPPYKRDKSLSESPLIGLGRERKGVSRKYLWLSFGKKWIKENIRAMGPALALLAFTLFISTFITEFTFIFGTEALWKTLLRFLVLSLILALPISLLPGLCSGTKRFLNHGNHQLIQIEKDRDLAVRPLEKWILRPLQGLGLIMLIATKFLAVLQIYTRHTIPVNAVLPSGHFVLWHFISTATILIMASLLLSFIWTLDDLGVRHFDRKTEEVRMIGKYLGLLLPILFGFYGVINLWQDHTLVLAVWYILQEVVILYPPVVFLGVLHSHYLRNHEQGLLFRLKAVRGNLLLNEKPMAPSSRTEDGRP
jgi:hypothetical protein